MQKNEVLSVGVPGASLEWIALLGGKHCAHIFSSLCHSEDLARPLFTVGKTETGGLVISEKEGAKSGVDKHLAGMHCSVRC